jgi:hypothetical protein
MASMRVFVSYTTADWRTARDVAKALETIGFGVLILAPNPDSPRDSDAVVRAQLSDAVFSADLICLVTSTRSIASAWVAFEFQEAAALVGRVVFVLAPGSMVAEHPATALIARITGAPSIIRHTVVAIPDVSLGSLQEVALQLSNDPYERNAPPLTKRVCMMKKLARRLSLAAHSEEKRVLVDTITYSPEEHPNRTPAQILFEVVRQRGLTEFNSLYRQQKVSVAHTVHDVRGDPLAPTGIDSLGVFRVYQGSAFA